MRVRRERGDGHRTGRGTGRGAQPPQRVLGTWQLGSPVSWLPLPPPPSARTCHRHPQQSSQTFRPPGTRRVYQAPLPPSTAAPQLGAKPCLTLLLSPPRGPAARRQRAGQAVPGRAAHRAAAVEVGEPQPSGSHPVQARRGRRRVPVAPQVPEAQVVRQQEDEAGGDAGRSAQGQQHQGPRQAPAPRPHGAAARRGPAARRYARSARATALRSRGPVGGRVRRQLHGTGNPVTTPAGQGKGAEPNPAAPATT